MCGYKVADAKYITAILCDVVSIMFSRRKGHDQVGWSLWSMLVRFHNILSCRSALLWHVVLNITYQTENEKGSRSTQVPL